MKRREFIISLGAGAAAAAVLRPSAARAQRAGKVFQIGYVVSHSADALPQRREAFRLGLRELGFQEGRDYVIEYRWADGRYDRLPALFADLVGRKVDVIVTHGTPAALAAKAATTTIPIVIAVVGDALAAGVVSDLARPGSNVTGSTYFNPELSAKRVELLKETIPGVADVGILMNPGNAMNNPAIPQMRQFAQSLKLELHQFGVSGPAEFAGAFMAMGAKRIGALVVLDDAILLAHDSAIATLALQRGLPSCGWSEYAIGGGLLAYGVDFTQLFRRAATFVVKILQGAKPGDLPVERAVKFETIVNLKTAKAIGVEIPTSMLLRADSVIE
jgi:putative ABC transport system substrate-binding protein